MTRSVEDGPTGFARTLRQSAGFEKQRFGLGEVALEEHEATSSFCDADCTSVVVRPPTRELGAKRQAMSVAQRSFAPSQSAHQREPESCVLLVPRVERLLGERLNPPRLRIGIFGPAGAKTDLLELDPQLRLVRYWQLLDEAKASPCMAVGLGVCKHP